MVSSEFNEKELVLDLFDVARNQTFQIFGIVRDNIAIFSLDNLLTGKFIVKKIQTKKQDKEIIINQLEFEYVAKPKTIFSIKNGKTVLDIVITKPLENQYYYAIFKDENNKEYKILSKAYHYNKIAFDVGLLKNQKYHLDRIESKEIDNFNKKEK